MLKAIRKSARRAARKRRKTEDWRAPVMALKARINRVSFYSEQLPGRTLSRIYGWVKPVLCPFHEEKTPSFTVNMTTGAFRCFGCGARGGDVIDFIMLKDGLRFSDALSALRDRWGA